MDIYTDIQSPAWQHRRLLILVSLHRGMPRQTCSCLAELHHCGHDWHTTCTALHHISQHSPRGNIHVHSHWASFSFSIQVPGSFFFFCWVGFFLIVFSSGILFLNGNRPDCLPVVAGKGWERFTLKYNQMRCGGFNLNPDTILYFLSFTHSSP